MTESSATILRRMLDERGVEHYDGTETTLWLKDGIGYRASADEGLNGYIHLHLWCTTPEQAIAATLGSCNCSDICTNGERTETCHVESSIIDIYEYNRWEYELSCGHTIIWEDSEPPNYCPICGRRIEQ